MTDLDQELRRILGEPPPDLHARERALIRLRAQMAEARERSKVGRKRARKLRLGVGALVLVLSLAIGLSLPNLRRPAVASELERLAQVSIDSDAPSNASEVRIREMYLIQGGGTQGSGNIYFGPGYTVIVHSIVTRTMEGGVLVQRRTITSADFASPDERAVWESLDSPPIPKIGERSTQRFDDSTFNLEAMPTDPEELRKALEDGTVIGYLPDGSQLFESIGSLLAEPALEPEQRVALYRVVESLDGVELLGDTPDPLGRIGVGFSYPVGSSRQVLIFDRNTGQPLAFEQYSAINPSQLEQWQAFDPPK